MASLASQRARSPPVAASAGRRAGPSPAAAPRAARPRQQRPDPLNIKISRAAFAQDVSSDWVSFRLTARCSPSCTDEFNKERWERAVAELLGGLREDTGGDARTAGTFLAPTSGGSRLVCTRLSATSELWEELQRRMTKQGWVDLAPLGGRDPAWPGFAAVSTAATDGEREVALVGLPTGFRASALSAYLRAAGWPISRAFRPSHPTLGVKRDNVIAVLVPSDLALPETVSLEVEDGETFVLQVKPESKLPPAPRFPGQAAASWAAVAGGGAPRGAPRRTPPPAAQAAPAPSAPPAASPSGAAPAGQGAHKPKKRSGRSRSRSRSHPRSRSRSPPGAGAAELSRGRSRSRSRSRAAAEAAQPAEAGHGCSRSRLCMRRIRRRALVHEAAQHCVASGTAQPSQAGLCPCRQRARPQDEVQLRVREAAAHARVAQAAVDARVHVLALQLGAAAAALRQAGSARDGRGCRYD